MYRFIPPLIVLVPQDSNIPATDEIHKEDRNHGLA